MLGAGEFILQVRHLLFCIVQHAAKFIGESQIGRGAMNCWAALQLRAQSFPQLIYICPKLLKEWSRDALALVQESGKKMFVRDFRMISTGSEVLLRLTRLLHLLRVFINAHTPRYERKPQRQLAVTDCTNAVCAD